MISVVGLKAMFQKRAWVKRRSFTTLNGFVEQLLFLHHQMAITKFNKKVGPSTRAQAARRTAVD
jgi:hypothetical protein